MNEEAPRGKLVVFSAPSGGGKSTIIHALRERFPHMRFSVSSTTRSRRNGEVDGVDYDFLTREQFLEKVEEGDFIEYEEVHGQLYGTRRSRVEQDLRAGRDIIFDIDVLGALTLKKVYPEALLVYIDVPSVEVLRERLVNRGREEIEEIERRLTRYQFERDKAERFDHIVVNDDLDTAVEEVAEILESYGIG
ncbi:guanylate kinase [bacterium]|nr:guanylate kinase [bacterium]